jgi:hypothetical protein
MKRTMQIVARVLIAAFLILSPTARAEVACGDNRDSVIKELGYADGRTAIGSMEVLSYRKGITVTLEKGVVVEIARKGQVAGLKHTDVTDPRANTTADLRRGPSPAILLPQRSTPATQPVPAAPVVSEPQVLPTPALATVVENDGQAPAKAQLPSAHRAAAPGFKSPAAQRPFSTPVGLPHIKAITAGGVLGLLALALGLYVFTSYCLKRICLKAGADPGVLIWIPIAQMVPLLRVAQLPALLVLLLFVPIVNFVFILVLWAKVSSALGKSPWLALLLLLPVLNLLLIPYLAFCGGGSEEMAAQPEPTSPPLPKEVLTPAT